MLKNLSIQNIALVERCDIEFTRGLNVLSGETGSGKSVILDSINFVLGQKADKSMITHGKNECVVTCEFDISDAPSARLALEDIGVGTEDTVIIKRVFNSEKGGSIKLNGETVSVGMLRKVTAHLVDIHGQSDHFALLNENAQLALLDEIAGDAVVEIKSKILGIVLSVRDINKQLAAVGGSDEERAARLDYLDYAINEIEKSDYTQGLEEQLTARRKMLQNLEKITLAVSSSSELLSGEGGAEDKLIDSLRQLSALVQFGEEYSQLFDDLTVAVDGIKDISARLVDMLESEYDEREADLTEKRLEAISRLKSKYGKTYDDVMSRLDEMKSEADTIRRGAEISIELNKKLSTLNCELKKEYDLLTDKRREAAAELSKELKKKLVELAMKNADFDVEFTSLYSLGRLDENGADAVRFMFSANKGEPLKPLEKVISGGELSRLMLGVKSVTANSHSSDTFIFDEIDSGISGAAAFVVAENFAKIAKSRQIIAISHLPQIVAMSDVSLLIQKHETESATRTTVTLLDEKQKIGELVRLVGGDEESAAAVTHAREMLEKAIMYKKSL